MDTYLENHIYSEYQGVLIDELFNFSLLHKKTPSIEVVKSKIRKPLRGLGMYIPNLKPADESIIEMVRLQEQGSLKGLGRKQNFYLYLAKVFIQNKPEPNNYGKKVYTYWRGAGRPKSITTSSEYS